jgi:hypothetical protein
VHPAVHIVDLDSPARWNAVHPAVHIVDLDSPARRNAVHPAASTVTTKRLAQDRNGAYNGSTPHLNMRFHTIKLPCTRRSPSWTWIPQRGGMPFGKPFRSPSGLL